MTDKPTKRAQQLDLDAVRRGTVQRCPTCGGKVMMPCRVCKMRERPKM